MHSSWTRLNWVRMFGLVERKERKSSSLPEEKISRSLSNNLVSFFFPKACMAGIRIMPRCSLKRETGSRMAPTAALRAASNASGSKAEDSSNVDRCNSKNCCFVLALVASSASVSMAPITALYKFLRSATSIFHCPSKTLRVCGSMKVPKAPLEFSNSGDTEAARVTILANKWHFSLPSLRKLYSATSMAKHFFPSPFPPPAPMVSASFSVMRWLS
mmetsp:Transcript_10677/g.13029  ORF Transcript_10677/g.13029 Transcript_10677/m.13029 type:complete len:216 (+) Transcript_10677:824-1471(+)